MGGSSKIWVIIAALVCVAILALGWLVGVAPKLGEAATALSQRADVEATNQTQEAALAKIKDQYAHIDDLKDQLAELRLQVPEGDGLADFFGELGSIGSATGTAVVSVTASDPEVFEPGVNKDAPSTVPTEALTKGNFLVIPITISAAGPQGSVLQFISKLQGGERLFVVNGFTLTNGSTTEGEESSEVVTDISTASITGSIYVLLDPSAVPATPVKTPSK